MVKSKKEITVEILKARVNTLIENGFELSDTDHNKKALEIYEQVHNGKSAPYGGKTVYFKDTAEDSDVVVELIVKAPQWHWDPVIYQAKVSASKDYGTTYRTTAMSDINKLVNKALKLRKERQTHFEWKANAEDKKANNMPIALADLREIFGEDAIIKPSSKRHDEETSSQVDVIYRGTELKFQADAKQWGRDYTASIKIGGGSAYFYSPTGGEKPAAYEKATTTFSAAKIKRIIDFTFELAQDAE